MQLVYALLLCVLLVSARRTFFDPFANHKRSIGYNQKIFDEDITVHDGLSYHRLKWNGHIKDEVISLDEEEGVDKVDCGPSYLSLRVLKSFSSSSRIETGSILVGGLRVTCTSDDGDELPIYRRVEKVVRTSPTELFIYTSDVSILDCFHRIDMMYEKSPPDANLNKRFTFSEEVSWDVFSFNYNSETQGPQTSFLPIYTLGDFTTGGDVATTGMYGTSQSSSSTTTGGMPTSFSSTSATFSTTGSSTSTSTATSTSRSPTTGSTFTTTGSTTSSGSTSRSATTGAQSTSTSTTASSTSTSTSTSRTATTGAASTSTSFTTDSRTSTSASTASTSGFTSSSTFTSSSSTTGARFARFGNSEEAPADGAASSVTTEYGAGIGCRDCYAALTAGFRISITASGQWGSPPIKLSHFKIEPFGILTMNLTAELYAGFQIKGSKETALTPELKLGAITITLGPVPLLITPSVSLRGRAEFEIGGRARLTTGYYYRSEVAAGIEYREDWGQFRRFSSPAVRNFQYRPPVFELEGGAEASLFLIPRLSFEFTSLLSGKAHFDLEPYLGASVTVGSNSGCSSLIVPHYQLFGGLNFKASLAKLAIDIAVTEFDLSSFLGLPKSFTFAIIPRYNFQCRLCSGCISIGSQEYYYWDVSDFAPCSVTCGEGTQTRAVNCRSSSGETQSDSTCLNANIGPKPSTSQTCQMLPCEPPCLSANTCSSCLEMSQCGWCGESSSCLPVINATTCSNSEWREYSCSSEPPIAIHSPTASTVWTSSTTVTVNWTGGVSQVFLRLKQDNIWIAGGLGLPEEPIPNSGSFEWHIVNVPTATEMQIAVVSYSDLANIDESELFTLRSAADVYNWHVGVWSSCSGACRGIQTRDVSCINTFGVLTSNESFCTSPKPATSQSCGASPPVTDCECVLNSGELDGGFQTCRSPTTGVCPDAYCCNECINYCSNAHWRFTTSNCSASCGGGTLTYTAKCQSNLNYLCYGASDTDWIGDGFCDPSLNVQGCWDGGDCCPQTCVDGDFPCGSNGYDCRDPEVISGDQPNLQDCEASNCYYNDGHRGVYPEVTCNDFPCITYSYIFTEWSNCSKTCGEGVRYRTIGCVSSAGEVVPQSHCTSTPPATQQSCTISQCIDYEIEVTSVFSVHVVGEEANITWIGGSEDGAVSIALIVGQDAPITLAHSVPVNDRSWTWNISSTIRSTTLATIRVTSSKNSNNFGLSNMFAIRNEESYQLVFTTAESNASLAVAIYGNLGMETILPLESFPANSTLTFTGVFLDVGDIYAFAVRTVTGGSTWSGREVTVLDQRGRLAEFGIHQSVGVEWIYRYDCLRFFAPDTCAQYVGCYWIDRCTSNKPIPPTTSTTSTSATSTATTTSTTSASATSTTTSITSTTTSTSATSTTSTSTTEITSTTSTAVTTTGVLQPATTEADTTESDVTRVSGSSQLKAIWLLLLVVFVLCLQ